MLTMFIANAFYVGDTIGKIIVKKITQGKLKEWGKNYTIIAPFCDEDIMKHRCTTGIGS